MLGCRSRAIVRASGQKSPSYGIVGRELGMNHLDGDTPVECRIGREEDHTHSASAKLPLEPVVRAQGCLQRGKEIDGRIAHIEAGEGESKNTPGPPPDHTVQPDRSARLGCANDSERCCSARF